MAFQTGGFAPFQFEPFGTFLALACFLVIASVLVFIFVAIWLYRDAEERGMSGALWLVILILASLFFPFIGGIVVLVIYLVVRMEHPVGAYPAGYGYGGYPPAVPPPAYPPPAAPPAAPAAPVPSDQPARPTTCKSCGAPLAPSASFCSSCGAKV